jgi:hypothetical protein
MAAAEAAKRKTHALNKEGRRRMASTPEEWLFRYTGTWYVTTE